MLARVTYCQRDYKNPIFTEFRTFFAYDEITRKRNNLRDYLKTPINQGLCKRKLHHYHDTVSYHNNSAVMANTTQNKK